MEHDDLPERLLLAAQRVAGDIVRRRLVPLWRVPFQLATRLQRVGGALAAYADDPTVIRDAVSGFAAALHDHPHSEYDRDFSPSGIEALWVEVCDAWDKTKVPGSDALTAAVAEARRAPVALLGKALAYGPLVVAVVGVAYHLHRHRHGDVIFLPVDHLAPLLGVPRTAVGAAIRHAMRLGLLVEVAPPNYRRGEARTLRFVEDCPLYLRPGITPTPDGSAS